MLHPVQPPKIRVDSGPREMMVVPFMLNGAVKIILVARTSKVESWFVMPVSAGRDFSIDDEVSIH